MDDNPAGASPVEQRVRALDPEREAFEAWCCKRWAGDRGALTPRDDGEYLNGHVQFAWCAWQASRVTCAAICDEAVQRYYSGGFPEAAGACLHLGKQMRSNARLNGQP